jgi:hypothetical protein
VRPAAAFGRDPGDDLVGVGDITGLAVDAVRGIEFEARPGSARRLFHLVHRRGAEVLARIAKLPHATIVADIEVCDLQVGGLVLLVVRGRVINGQRVWSNEFPSGLGLRFRVRHFTSHLHALVPGLC